MMTDAEWFREQASLLLRPVPATSFTEQVRWVMRLRTVAGRRAHYARVGRTILFTWPDGSQFRVVVQ